MSYSYDGKKVVWILGSGFSRSLGGPLLDDLLSERGQQEGKHRLGGVFGNIHDFYWNRLKGSPKQMEPAYWSNAEEFLDFIECAVEDKSLQALLPDSDPRSLHRLAVLAVASECLFDSSASPEAEAWQPYIEWARDILRPGDSVVTFNYDFVPDVLIGWEPHRTWVVPEPHQDRFKLGGADAIHIFKLHGSINWFPETVAYGRENVVAALRNGTVPILGTPGPSKRRLSMTEFQPLWHAASTALAEADVVVFMGYRFPPSDSQARAALLGAINKNTKPHLRIHTVLGPRTHDDATVRLIKLLEHSLRGGGRVTIPEHDEQAPDEMTRVLGIPGAKTFAIVPQPLYVEDFLTVIHEEELFGY